MASLVWPRGLGATWEPESPPDFGEEDLGQADSSGFCVLVAAQEILASDAIQQRDFSKRIFSSSVYLFPCDSFVYWGGFYDILERDVNLVISRRE